MNKQERSCFVIMPFKEELHYFYLYLKKHIEEKHSVSCLRGDSDVLTVPVLDKIKEYIRKADVVIADCSDRNPNVFYELGMAHTLGKKVILITKDSIKDAPTDIRHFEFVPYTLDKHVEFLKQLDNALHGVFVDQYEELYSVSVDLFNKFRSQTKIKADIAAKELFIERISAASRTQGLPSPSDELSVMEFALPRLVADNGDFEVMSSLTGWITQQLEGCA